MDYYTYHRFKGKGIGGNFNLPRGTIVREADGLLYATDGRCICAATSENGWEHFHPNTPMGFHRQRMLNALYIYYAKHQTDDFAPGKWPGATNLYWKNLLRTMPTAALEAAYKRRIGDKYV